MKPRISLGVIALILICFGYCQKKNSTAENSYRINGTIISNGMARTYLLNLPPDYYSSNNFPLVIALHGGGGSGQQFESKTGLTEKAKAEHFVIVYPDGFPGPAKNRSWNAGSCCGAAQADNIDDVDFIKKLIVTLKTNYKIDPKRVYVTGHSNGGMLAYRLADELSDAITAIAVNSCTMVVTAPVHPLRPVPVLHIHSILDEKVPFNGGVGITGAYYPPVDSVLKVWAGTNACANTPQTTVYNTYLFRQWLNCNNKASVQLYLTNDGGHSWPGGQPDNPNSDPSSTAINATDLLWNFFQKYTLP